MSGNQVRRMNVRGNTPRAACFFGCAIIFILVLSGLSLAADIRAVPSAVRVSPGETFYVDVVASNVPAAGLGAVQFRLNVLALGSKITAVADTSQGAPGEVAVSTPLVTGPSTSTRSGLGGFFWGGRGPSGVLVLDNEALQGGSGLYTFGHTNGAVAPSGEGTVARFIIAVGREVLAERIAVSLSDVLLMESGTVYPLDSNTGTTVELRCYATVPSLLGLSLADAQSALLGAKLVQGNVYELDNHAGAYALNRVLAQTPSANSAVLCGSAVGFAINVPPAEVGNIVVTPKTGDESGSVILSWTPSPSADAAGYRVYQAETGALLKLLEPATATGTEISGLPYGKASQLRITAHDYMGNESLGVTVSATPSDDVPPVGTVTINGGAAYTKSANVTLALSASDAGSGIAMMCVSNASSCSSWEGYATGRTWMLAPGDGGKTVYVWYKDASGNVSAAPSVAAITLDGTPPLLEVSTLSDGNWTNNDVLNVAGTAADNQGLRGITINGDTVPINGDGTFSYAVVLHDGPNTVKVVAADLAGNESTDTRTINLDRSVPVISLLSPVDNIKTKQTPIDIIGSVDEQSAVTVRINGATAVAVPVTGGGFSMPIEPVYGLNTVEVTATDAAGNSSTVKRTFIFDDRNPALAVTEPAQDIRTNNAVVIIKGEVSDITAVTVTLTMDGVSYTPAVIDGKFEQPLNFTTEKIYQIFVEAVNEVGNTSVVQRNIIYDITKPSVTVNPVNSPTNRTDQVLAGTREAGAVVMVACPTATVGAVTALTETSWSVELSNLKEGSNSVTVTASDAAGNVSDIVTVEIVVDTIAPDTMIISAPGLVTKETSAVFSFSSTEAASTFQCTLDGAGAADCTSPVSYNGLPDGTHTLSVAATDSAGNADPTPAVYTWSIDTTAPHASITSSPAALTNSTTAVIGFVSDEADATFQCRLDGGSFADCISPVTYNGLSDGPHTVFVLARDVAGNSDQNPASCTWSIDTVAPVVSITTSTADVTNSASATFDFVSNEAGSTFLCNLDGGDMLPCTSPISYASLADGSHTFTVKATDMAGNTSPSPVTHTWTIDTVAPTSYVTAPGRGSTVMATTVLIKGAASDVGSRVQKIEVSTDGGALWYAADGTTGWSYSWTVPSDGTYTIMSRATDRAGNVESPMVGVTLKAYRRQPSEVVTANKQLLVNGNPLQVKGVFYSPVPNGVNPQMTPPYGDYFTAGYGNIYNRDLPLLRQMGANAVRLWTWDITADHHDFLDAAYNGGADPIYVIAGLWINAGMDIDPSSAGNSREKLKTWFKAMVATHRNHPAVLMWAIGNDLNANAMYGSDLSNLFSLIEEMAALAHAEEGSSFHPVTAVFEDRNLISMISSYESAVPSLDIWGVNVFRGNTFGTLFNDYRSASSKPLAILQFSIDAFDNINGDEYETLGTPYQATYSEALWNEISANSNVCVGGSILEYSDEWWRGKNSLMAGCSGMSQAVHSACGNVMTASPDGFDNAEWWGIMRTVPNGSGPDTVEPRAVYYTLQEIWRGLSNNPHISVSPGSLNFGGIEAGGSSQLMTVTVSNTGADNLSLGAIRIAADGSPDFTVQNDGCSGHTLVPSKTCALKVACSPTAAGTKSATLVIPSNDPNAAISTVTLAAVATSSISGSITSGGSPLAGVMVSLSGAASAMATTDDAGNYVFVGLGTGSYAITPVKTGYVFDPANLQVSITGPKVTGQNFTATAVYQVSGTITSGGSPLPGVTVTLSGGASSTTVTDAAGNYVFGNLGNGNYEVRPNKACYNFTPNASAVSIGGADVTGRNFAGDVIMYTITPSAGTGGTISPSAAQTAGCNSTVAFSIAPAAGYHLTDVSVDGVSQGPISSYAFTNISADHIISASFSRNFGVFGITKISSSGSGYVDSYDSTRGLYGGVHGPNGSIGTNAITNGAINLSGSSAIYGDALVGPGGNPTNGITLSSTATIYGSKGTLVSARTLTPKTDPGGGTPATFTNGTTLTSGTYRVGSINLSGSGVGTISGDVTMYVTGGISVSGLSQIVIQPGASLTVYVSGNIGISGGGFVNMSLDPHKLTIYGTSTCTSIGVSGNGNLYGVIYAPKAGIGISGTGSIYGAVVGNTISMSNIAAVHYDESLGDINGQ